MYLFIFEDENMYFLKTWNKKCAYLADCLFLLLLLLLITFLHIYDNDELTKMDSGRK